MTVYRKIELPNGSILEFRSNAGAEPKVFIDGKPAELSEYKEYIHQLFPEMC